MLINKGSKYERYKNVFKVNLKPKMAPVRKMNSLTHKTEDIRKSVPWVPAIEGNKISNVVNNLMRVLNSQNNGKSVK